MKFFFTFFFFVNLGPTTFAHATVRGYTGWISQDPPTMGMAGATIAMPDQSIGSFENPAATAMLVPGIQVSTSQTAYRDRSFISGNDSISSASFAIGGPIPDFGITFGRWSTHLETSLDGRAQQSSREYQIALSKLFSKRRLSLGLSLHFAENNQVFNRDDYPGIPTGIERQDRTALGFGAGFIYRLPSRFFFGGQLVTPFTFKSSPAVVQSLEPPFQDALSPWRYGLGLGWVPNRLFKVGFSVKGTSQFPGADRFGNPGVSLDSLDDGKLQYHLGARYRFLEVFDLNAAAGTGFYLDSQHRVHWTWSTDLEIWLLWIGFAIDNTARFSNTAFYVGLDVVGLARKMGWVPPEPNFDRKGLLPPPLFYSDDGLSNRIRLKNKISPANQQVDIEKVAEKLPHNVQDAAKNPGKEINNLGKDFMNSVNIWKKELNEENKKRKKEPRKPKPENQNTDSQKVRPPALSPSP